MDGIRAVIYQRHGIDIDARSAEDAEGLPVLPGHLSDELILLYVFMAVLVSYVGVLYGCYGSFTPGGAAAEVSAGTGACACFERRSPQPSRFHTARQRILARGALRRGVQAKRGARVPGVVGERAWRRRGRRAAHRGDSKARWEHRRAGGIT